MRPYPRRSVPYTLLQSPDYFIGVDPDTGRSGVAIRHQDTLTVTLMNLFEFTSYLQSLSGSVVIRVSAGWLNKTSAFNDRAALSHVRAGLIRKGLAGVQLQSAMHKATAKVQRKASESVGRNHEAGLQLVAFCRQMGYTVEEVRPMTRKMTLAAFTQITKIILPKSAAQEMIDSYCLIA